MGLDFRWATDRDLDVVSLCRMRCFGHAQDQLERITRVTLADRRARPEDMLLAETAGEPVGTATALSMRMWVRGGPVPIQGVGWVGTVKTQRRAAGLATGQGIASQLMHRMLDRARERGEVLSALMPWRASFYEHFGYGLVERRHEWTVPLSLLPSGPTDGWEFVPPATVPTPDARQAMVEAGQCDIERPLHAWGRCFIEWQGGFLVADRSTSGAIRSWMFLLHEQRNGLDYLRVHDWARSSPAELLRQLQFLASLRDQYHSAIITVPADLPLNLLLKEHQLPHRLVNHETAVARTCTRMQVRVLDHQRLIQSMVRLPANVRGAATIAIQETEGTITRIRIEMEAGRAQVKEATDEPDIECSDRNWGPVVLGELTATQAAQLGLIRVHKDSAMAILDAFAAGPLPFCNEYF